MIETTDLNALKQQAQLATLGIGFVTVSAEILIDLINSLSDAHDSLAQAENDIADLEAENRRAAGDIDDLGVDIRAAESEIVVLEDEVKNLRAIVEEDEASPF